MAESNQDVLKMLLIHYSGASGPVEYSFLGKIKRIGGVSLNYSLLGRLKSIGANTSPYVLKYDFWGRIKQVAILSVLYLLFSNDIRSVGELQVGYDAQNRIRELGELKVNYNARGNIVAIGEMVLKRSGWLDRISSVENKGGNIDEQWPIVVPEQKPAKKWLPYLIVTLLLLGTFFIGNGLIPGPGPIPSPTPVTLTPSPQPLSQTCITPTEDFAGGAINIRQEPKEESIVVGTLKYGAVVVATVRSGEGWYALLSGGYVGSRVVNEVPCRD